jgi:hypothetical protein
MRILENQLMSFYISAGDIRISAQACNLCLVQLQTFPYDMNPDQIKEVMLAPW